LGDYPLLCGEFTFLTSFLLLCFTLSRSLALARSLFMHSLFRSLALFFALLSRLLFCCISCLLRSASQTRRSDFTFLFCFIACSHSLTFFHYSLSCPSLFLTLLLLLDLFLCIVCFALLLYFLLCSLASCSVASLVCFALPLRLVDQTLLSCSVSLLVHTLSPSFIIHSLALHSFSLSCSCSCSISIYA